MGPIVVGRTQDYYHDCDGNNLIILTQDQNHDLGMMDTPFNHLCEDQHHEFCGNDRNHATIIPVRVQRQEYGADKHTSQ